MLLKPPNIHATPTDEGAVGATPGNWDALDFEDTNIWSEPAFEDTGTPGSTTGGSEDDLGSHHNHTHGVERAEDESNGACLVSSSSEDRSEGHLEEFEHREPRAEPAPPRPRRAPASPKARLTEWKLLDCSCIDPSICSLSSEDRKQFYDNLTQQFSIRTSGVMGSRPRIEGLPCPERPSTLQPISRCSEILVIVYLTFHTLLYTFPGLLKSTRMSRLVLLILFGTVCFFGLGLFYSIFWSLVGTALLFYPHSKWDGFECNPLFVCILRYFSWRIAWHPSVSEYLADCKADARDARPGSF